MKIHPAADLFPMLPDDELQELADDIRTIGQQEPCVLFKGELLDGRNRAAACKLLGIEPKTRTLNECPSPTAYVISLNVRRRHLTPIQRASLAADHRVLEMFRAEAKERQRAGGEQRAQAQRDEKGRLIPASGQTDRKLDDAGEATVQAAQAFKAGTGAVKTMAQVAKTAPAVYALAKNGVIPTVADAKRISALPEEQRAAVVEAVKEGAKPKQAIRDVTDAARAAIAESVRRETDTYLVLHGDLIEAGRQIPDESVDVIITDPPYPEKFLPVYADLAVLAARVLKPGGSCVAMIGQSYLPEILSLMAPHLTYQWMLAYLTPGGQSAQLWERKVNTFWKPLLWFVKGRYQGSWIGDVRASHPNDNDKRFHHWGQSESGMADIVEHMTSPGQTILDPFCGGGTTGIVARDLGRRFIGIDVDEQQVKNTLARLAS